MIGLAPIDGLVVLAVLAKAIGYGAALLAMGGVLFSAVFSQSAEASVLRAYIDWMVSVPWKNRNRVCNDLKKAEKVLEEDIALC